MIGQDLYDDTKPNMTLLQQKVRQKNKKKPFGRKAPRKKDFGKIATKIGNFLLKSCLNEVNTYIHIAMVIILCMCHAHYMHVFVLRKFLICKLENQLLSRQI